MNPNSQTADKKPGFLREGFRELSRKLDRRNLRDQTEKLSAERGQAAMRLGEQAWREKVGLEDLAALQAQLQGLESRADALGATHASLQKEQAVLDARQREEGAKFDALRKEVETKKAPVDQSLATTRERLNAQTRSTASLQARLGSIASGLSALENAPATGAVQDPGQLAQRESQKQQLMAEQKRVSEELATANANLPALSAEMARLEGESRQLAGEIQKVEADRAAALAPVQAELKRVSEQTSAAQKAAGSIAEGRRAAFTQLGQALYESKSTEPALAAGIAEMATIDGNRASAQSALDASLLQTQSMKSGTMLKFWGTAVMVPLLLILLVAGFSAWAWWHHRPSEEQQMAMTAEQQMAMTAAQQLAKAVAGGANPYLHIPATSSPAYLFANLLATASNEDVVNQQLLNVFQILHVGVYTPDGRQVLAGSERNDSDFYLYDFEVRILAHAFFEHNVTNIDDESAALGAAILQLDQPESFAPVLKKNMASEYTQALQNPMAPSSFLILLVDGLARHQPNPYSLDEVVSRPGTDLYLDPVQSFLIMLNAFVPATPSTDDSLLRNLRLPWDEMGVVHAADPCSDVKGDGSGGDWGGMAGHTAFWAGLVAKGGVNAVTKLAGKLATAASAVAAVHDLLWLYAVTIHIGAPGNLHWNHDSDARNPAPFVAFVLYELKDPPTGPIRCGAATGQTLPQVPQRLPGVQLMWKFSPQSCLQMKEMTPEQAKSLTGESNANVPGSLSGSLGLQTTTQPDGTARLDMEVSCQCPREPWGGTKSTNYMVSASTRSVSSKLPAAIPGGAEIGPWAVAGMILNRLPGGVEYIMGGKSGYARFTMDHHLKGQYGE